VRLEYFPSYLSDIFSKEKGELGRFFDISKVLCYDGLNITFPWKPYPWILKSGPLLQEAGKKNAG
jgi:hypothetical protein